MEPDLEELYRLIGKSKYDEIVNLARELAQQGKSPDEIAQAVAARYPDVVGPMIIFALCPIVFVLAPRQPKP